MWPFQRRGEFATETRASLENPQIPLGDVNAWRSLLGEWHGVAGVNVTAETALEVPAIWAAVNFISGSFASLPLEVFIKTDGGRDPDTKNPLHSILHDAPNEEWTSFAWRKYSMANALLRGRSLTFIERNKARRVMNLWPLDTDKTIIRRVDGKKYYDYQDGARKVTYTADEIIDVPFLLGYDGVTHVDPLNKLRGAIGLGIALEQYAQKFFANGGVPPLALYGPMKSPSSAGRASSDVEQAIRGANAERRNVLIMPDGHELKPVGIDPQKSQMEEARRFQVIEIARVFGLPPVFLQDLTNGTYSNTEQQDLAFTKHCLGPWLKAWEQELNLKLFTARNTSRYVEFNVDGLLRGDFTTRMTGWAQGIQNGIVKPKEAREAENWPDAGPEADKLYIQGATVPLGTQPTATPPANDNNRPSDKKAAA